ncbi:MAG: RrF2 family transcriptional regulator [Clostridiales bacterium]|nr:RrF2 family transcriptional regulator [Clostridiales bacterium]
MKISTRGRYALRMMIDLAMHGNDQYVTIKEISQRQGISAKYLEQIISVLSKASYVKGLRGASGGYKLSRPPEEYTVGMILRLIEGDLVPVKCMESDPIDCARADICVTLEVWKKIYDAISNVIDNITLADLVEMQIEKLSALGNKSN